MMVRDFQRVIGREGRARFSSASVDCRITWSPVSAAAAIRSVYFMISSMTRNVKMIGVEAGGPRRVTGRARGTLPRVWWREHRSAAGHTSYVLQDERGQIAATHSISAGLDYPSVGPEHAYLHDVGRVDYVSASDDEACSALRLLAELEGIIPALESAHAIAHLLKLAPQLGRMRLFW
jgi:tryptophan synthase beta chain